jgi:hypothetical protein
VRTVDLDHRGLAHQPGVQRIGDGTTVTLTDARCAIYWSIAMRGVFGLAASGPDKDCRIGAAVSSLTLHDVTAMAPCTDAAVAAWQAAPWK